MVKKLGSGLEGEQNENTQNAINSRMVEVKFQKAVQVMMLGGRVNCSFEDLGDYAQLKIKTNDKVVLNSKGTLKFMVEQEVKLVIPWQMEKGRLIKNLILPGYLTEKMEQSDKAKLVFEIAEPPQETDEMVDEYRRQVMEEMGKVEE